MRTRTLSRTLVPLGPQALWGLRRTDTGENSKFSPGRRTTRGTILIKKSHNWALRALVCVTLIAGTSVFAAPASAAAPRCGGERATLVGSAQAEELVGSPRRDVIVGSGGNDTIVGKSGNDILCGGGGDDTIRGGG